MVIQPQLLEAVHQVVQPLLLLVDDLPVVGQGVKQRLSLRHEQAPADSNEERLTVNDLSEEPSRRGQEGSEKNETEPLVHRKHPEMTRT